MNRLVTAIVCCGMLSASHSASAKVLFEIDTDLAITGGGSTITPTSSFTPAFELQSRSAPIEFFGEVFAGVTITMADVGTTYEATAATDPGFVDVARLLTDGQEQTLILSRGAPGGAFGASECNWFHRDHTCGTGVDLAGHVIDRITFTLKDWYTVTPGSDPNGDGLWHEVYSSYRITIEGRVPEPSSTGLLVVMGIVVVASDIRRRKTKPLPSIARCDPSI